MADEKFSIRLKDWFALGAIDTAAHSSNTLAPFVVGAIIGELHFAPSRMGVWSTVETLCYAFAMFVLAPRVARLSLPHVATGAALLTAAAQILSGFTDSYTILLLLRVGTGLGFGVLNTALNTYAARTKTPDRAVSVAMAIQTALFTGMGFLMPIAGLVAGRKGMFVTLGLLVLALIPFMILAPSSSRSSVGVIREAQKKSLPWPPGYQIALLLGTMALFTFGTLSVWPFTDRLALSVGIHAKEYGELNSISCFLGFFGSISVEWLRVKFGRTAPTVFFILISGIACVAQSAPPNALWFVVGFVVNYVLWFIVYPFLIGTACAVDPAGRLATLCTATWLVSQSLGNVIAGIMGDSGRYWMTGIMALICCVLASALFVMVTRSLQKPEPISVFVVEDLA
jgi:predicted MFS family arabinose efflux permease